MHIPYDRNVVDDVVSIVMSSSTAEIVLVPTNYLDIALLPNPRWP